YEQHDENIFIGRELTQAKEYSEETARKIDAEIASLITASYKTAQGILNEEIEILHALSDLLLEKETVMGKELDELVKSMKPDFVFPKKNEGKYEEFISEPKSEPEAKEKDKDIKLDIDDEVEDSAVKDSKDEEDKA
ncbi:MAG: cell division protein FtsH, partial [Desulfobacteraceae bacterium]|nr:cell division protein FtsH [Desulfobacteraceae bacterium]